MKMWISLLFNIDLCYSMNNTPNINGVFRFASTRKEGTF